MSKVLLGTGRRKTSVARVRLSEGSGQYIFNGKKIGLPEHISFRLNPGFGKGSFSQITTAGENAKFGIPSEKIVS